MPAVQRTYGMMQPAIEGEYATMLNDSNSETRQCCTSAGIAFARAVSEGVNARECVLGGTDFIGISVRDVAQVHPQGDLYRMGGNVAVMLSGDVWVRVVSAVTHGAIGSYDAITGQFNPASGGVEIYDSRYITSAGAGQLAQLRLLGPSSGTDDDESGPDWVPVNAKVHIDFLGGAPQGLAWNNGAEVAIDTLLGGDLNTENAWGVSGYDATFLTADGYNNPDHAVAFIGDARTRIIGSATLTFKLKQLGGGGLSSPAFVVASADGNDALEIDLVRDLEPDVVAVVSSWNGEPEVMSPPVIDLGDGSFNMTAITITATRFESSYNGCAPVVYPITEAGRPSGNPLVAALLDIVASSGAGATVALQSITIYDPLPDTTGLSELSGT